MAQEAVHKRGTAEGSAPVPLKGMFPYAFNKGKPIGERWYDHSVSQYGVLAMWALQQMNFEVPPDYWKVTEQAWREQQNDDGGWSYRFRDGDPSSTVPMTAAGLATLFITQDYVHSMEGLACNGNVKDKHLELALRWMNTNFKSIDYLSIPLPVRDSTCTSIPAASISAMRPSPRSSNLLSTACTKLTRPAGTRGVVAFKNSGVAKCSSSVMVRMDSDCSPPDRPNTLPLLLANRTGLTGAVRKFRTNQGLAVLSLMETNSTSKMSVAFGPITLPAPRSP